MREYLNTLIVTVIVSQLAVRLAPGKNSARKYVLFVCGVVVMLCLMRPLIVGIERVGELIDGIRTFSAEEYHEETVNDKYFDTAAVIMSYIADEYGISPEKIKMTVITDEADSCATEIHIYLTDCTADKQSKIEAELSRELTVPVYVFVG